MELQFDENGKLIVPELIQQDLDETKEAKEQGLTLKELRKAKRAAENQEKKNKREHMIQAAIYQRSHITIEIENRKFKDNELIFYHEQGFSDYEIARIFKCNPTTVWQRRCKLMLVANFKPPYGLENLTPDELHERYRAMIERTSIRAKERMAEEALIQPLSIQLLNNKGGAQNV